VIVGIAFSFAANRFLQEQHQSVIALSLEEFSDGGMVTTTTVIPWIAIEGE
jgi:hypothetical protein